jgi:hypothetical protein
MDKILGRKPAVPATPIPPTAPATPTAEQQVPLGRVTAATGTRNKVPPYRLGEAAAVTEALTAISDLVTEADQTKADLAAAVAAKDVAEKANAATAEAMAALKNVVGEMFGIVDAATIPDFKEQLEAVLVNMGQHRKQARALFNFNIDKALTPMGVFSFLTQKLMNAKADQLTLVRGAATEKANATAAEGKVTEAENKVKAAEGKATAAEARALAAEARALAAEAALAARTDPATVIMAASIMTGLPETIQKKLAK